MSGVTPEKQLATLEHDVCRLVTAGLRLLKDKFLFALWDVVYFGHKTLAPGVHSALKNVRAITEAPEPTENKSSRSFSELSSFYDRFLYGRARLDADSCPLLSKYRACKLEERHQKEFQELMIFIIVATVLTHDDEDKSLLLSCVASSYCVEAVLTQLYFHGMGLQLPSPRGL